MSWYEAWCGVDPRIKNANKNGRNGTTGDMAGWLQQNS